MNVKNYSPYLDLSDYFIDNINKIKIQNDYETEYNNFKNSHIDPKFRYYKDDTNLNFNRSVIPNILYKNKQLFGPEKPIQTEQDEIGLNHAYLNKHFGYTDYGNYNIANQSLPEANKHKTTPKNNLFELL
jgi:hypothetical protein